MEGALTLRTSLITAVLSLSLIAGCSPKSKTGDTTKTVSSKETAETVKPRRVDDLMKGRESTIIGLNYVGMTVADVDRSKAFYTNAIDLKTVDIDIAGQQKPLPASIAPRSNLSAAVILQGPNSYLRLMEYEAPMPARSGGIMPVQGPGITHICFVAPKERPIDGKFIEQGATWQTTSGAMVDMRGVGYMYGYLRDTDGLMLEVEHSPGASFERGFWMGHVAIATPDMTKALEFYKKVFGFDPYRRVDDISGPTFSDVGGVENMTLHGGWFRLAPFYNLELWQFTHPKTLPKMTPAKMDQIGYSLIMLETTDIEADYERIKSQDIKLLSGIVPVIDGRAFYLRDLDGNLVGFTQFDEGSKLSLKALEGFERE